MPYRCLACSTSYDERVAWCWTCGGPGLVVPAGRRPPSALDRHFAVTNAKVLARSRWTLVPSESYPELRVLAGALVVIFGPPAAGKSTLLARWLDGVRGPVILVAAEEHLGPAMGTRLARLGIKREDFVVVAGGGVDDLVAEVTARSARVVGIDSLSATTMTPEDLRRLVAAGGLLALVVTLQVTKAGLPSGSNRLLHEADVVIEVDGARWAVRKSRYQAVGVGGEVLDQEEAVNVG